MELFELESLSPLRLLGKTISDGLGEGNLGVIMARAGVGKSSFLVQIGLDRLIRGRRVLHFALGRTTNQVQVLYNVLFETRVNRVGLKNWKSIQTDLMRQRMLKALPESALGFEKLKETLDSFKRYLTFTPETLLIDGYDWPAVDEATNRKRLEDIKTYAKEIGTEIWMTAQTFRKDHNKPPPHIPAPCGGISEVFETVIFLEPRDQNIAVRLLKQLDKPLSNEMFLYCHPLSLEIAIPEREDETKQNAAAFTLLSGGADGAETEFGACAEKWGLDEVTFTFEGRKTKHRRGLLSLTEEELAQGDVSEVYLKSHMNRTYPDTPEFRKTLQSIWHQVNTAGEIFVIGVIQPDNTVRGGTGWAAELGRRLNKPVHVYDQTRKAWFIWQDNEWQKVPPPIISRTRFNGTGTKHLNEHGRQAIRALYERTFGSPPV